MIFQLVLRFSTSSSSKESDTCLLFTYDGNIPAVSAAIEENDNHHLPCSLSFKFPIVRASSAFAIGLKIAANKGGEHRLSKFSFGSKVNNLTK